MRFSSFLLKIREKTGKPHLFICLTENGAKMKKVLSVNLIYNKGRA
jgi:hypothetical protein